MAFRKTVFAKYGVFRTDLGPTEKNPCGRGEDCEFSDRLLKHDETLMYAPDAVVYHPVEKKRLSRKYFKTWYFNNGRYQARITVDFQERSTFGLGVPRSYWRGLIRYFVRWIGTRDKLRSSKNEMQFYETLGTIAEFFSSRTP
jgi:GT2 family glycosyltransferase